MHFHFINVSCLINTNTVAVLEVLRDVQEAQALLEKYLTAQLDQFGPLTCCLISGDCLPPSKGVNLAHRAARPTKPGHRGLDEAELDIRLTWNQNKSTLQS